MVEGREQVKFDVNVELKDGNELIVTHREGKAPDIDVPQQLKFSGNITSPADFFEDRASTKRKLLDTNVSHVEVDNRKLTIALIIDEKHPKRTEIIGTLQKNPDLEAFGIWEKQFEHGELLKFIRKNRRFFNSKEECDKLIRSLANFKYDRNISGKTANDNKGNIEEGFKQTLTQNIKLEFKLNIPLFEGFPERTFLVEIVPDITDAGSRFWFESVGLLELQEKEAKAILDKEIKRFKEIVILYKN
jgi:hypothetical protein